MIFFPDVDLTNSAKLCIKYLLKKIRNNSYVYTDDACNLIIVYVWFYNQRLKDNLNQNAPGYIGLGCCLPILKNFSSVDYTYKSNINSSKNLKKCN